MPKPTKETALDTLKSFPLMMKCLTLDVRWIIENATDELEIYELIDDLRKNKTTHLIKYEKLWMLAHNIQFRRLKPMIRFPIR